MRVSLQLKIIVKMGSRQMSHDDDNFEKKAVCASHQSVLRTAMIHSVTIIIEQMT
jgi:hypothetical protein